MPSAQVSVIVCGPTLYTIANFGRSTRMVKSHVLVLPQASVATTCTVFVVPRTKVEPDGGVEVTVTLVLQSSVAITDQVTTTLVRHVSTIMLVGQTSLGGKVSTTRTVCVQGRLRFWQQSIATQVREIV